MRQFMQSVVALMVLMSPALPASATLVRGLEANDSVAVENVEATVESRIITGTVYDAATNIPLPGVRVQGTGYQKITTMTDADGKYTLTIPSYVTLLSFSTPEYRLTQRPVLNNDVINVRLYTDKFSSVYNDEIKASVSSDLQPEMSSAITIDAEIQNKMGADVRSITRSATPGIGNVMFIRGINSINGNTQPLVVVDGVILDLQEKSEALHMGMYNNILSSIDVNDIEDVKLLKSGTSIYGTRAANGVILITTRRGRSMATRITANIYGSYTLTPNMPDLMNAEQYRTYANELIGTMDVQRSEFPFLQSNPDYYQYNMYHNETDWSDYVYREAFTQNYKVNVEGGDEIAMYNFSLGYTGAESTLKGNDFSRMNIRFNSDIELSQTLKTRFDISYNRVTRELLDDGVRADFTSYPVSSIGFLSAIKAPFLSPYKYSTVGKITDRYDKSDSFAHGIDMNAAHDNNFLYNPMTILSIGSGDNKNDQEYTHFGITVAPELKLGDFTLTEIFNYSLHRMNEKYYLPYANSSGPNFYAENLGEIENYLGSSFGKEAQLSSETRATWSKLMGAHAVDALLGFRFTNFRSDANFLTGANSGNDKATNITNDNDYLSNTGSDNTWINLAWFMDVNYSYKMRYFLQATASMETSSRYGKNADNGIKLGGVKWGLFPSLQAAWLISSESWFNVKPVNSLKLRAGFDITGNDAVDYYASRSYLQNIKFQEKFMGLQIGNVENDGLKWETTSRFNVGLDAVLFNDRVALSFDWYKSKTSDLFLPKTYDYVTGMNTYWANGGDMENSGFEVALSAKLINTDEFQWEMGVSAGHYKNEITSLDEPIENTKVYGGEVAIKEGEPIGLFWGYKTDGVIKSSDEVGNLHYKDASNKDVAFVPGDVKFVDIVGNDGCIDENDKTVIGDPHPDLYGNIYTTLSYKNWKLNIGLNYSLGNDVYNYYRQQLESGKNFFNQSSAMLNRWTYEGQNTTMPRAVYGDPNNNSRFSDRWIEDGSYLRLKTVQLSYKIPVSLSWLQGITVWAAGENLLTFTKYLGNDPEFSVSNNVLYQGVDAGLVPQSASIHLGVKVNL